jgi:hypothetical protein
MDSRPNSGGRSGGEEWGLVSLDGAGGMGLELSPCCRQYRAAVSRCASVVYFPEALSLPAEPLLGVLDEKLGLSMPGDSVVFTAQRVCIRVEFTVLPAYMPPR